MDRKAILILGMHRAGTSALARVCSLRGATLPEHVLPPNQGNASGYWEPQAVVALNTRILASFDLTWDDPWAGRGLPGLKEFPMEFLDQARELIVREYGDSPLFVMKDPRCTLLRDFWFDVIQSLGITACPVVVMRPWDEVVASLVRRDGTSPESAALLYVAHGLAASCATRYKASFATYGQLTADWRATTDRIAVEQGFTWPAGIEAGPEVEAYLRPSCSEGSPASLPAPLAAWADAVWRWSSTVADGGAEESSTLDAVRGEFERYGDLLAPLLRDRARLQRKTEAQRDEAMVERDSALRVYRDTDARLHSTQAEFEKLQSEMDARLSQTQSDYVERDQEATSLRVALDAAQDQARQLQHEARQLQHELSITLGSRSWKLTRPLRFAVRQLRRLSPGNAGEAHASRSVQSPSIGDAPRRTGSLHHSHPRLREFLVSEFGQSTAADVIRRIDRYRLPIPRHEAQATTRVDCSEAEALEWARAIALRAAGRDARQAPPDVSIVVPVYNQLPFTLACIDALLNHDSRYSFEVLVGDDGSTDATAEALSVAIPGVRHIRHASNLGFVRNCNETARQASGRYVLFLNNDTQVLPHWLDELIDVLEADPGIGLAGSKLIYADGLLQECGAIVWRDGSAWNHGRLADPRRPEFCYLRDADYVSGASIALRRSLWEELGGFDELFVPAYAEDADLAFRVRDRGLRTVVQPLSQVIHFEGITSGTDLGTGAKAYQVDNLKKLKVRWAHVLATHRDNADQPELEKERAVGKRALFIDHCTPTPNEDAGSVVATEVMRIFADCGYKVTFIPEDNFAHVGAPTADLQRRGIEAIYHPAYSRMATFLAQRKDRFDVIFLHRFGVGKAHLEALRRNYPDAKIIFLNADMHHVREMREAELSGDGEAKAGALRTRELELKVAAQADVTLVHSDYERDLLQRELPGANVVLFPLVHDPLDEVPPLSARDGVCFVGGFRHPPNADGIRWFVETAWPLVLAQVPDAQLYIVGSHMPPEVRALGEVAGVRSIGFVEDLDPFMARRRITVAPLRYGAGAKGKVAGSLAQGVPVVCTPIAAEGMQLEPGANVLVGTTPEELARHVVELLASDDEWRRLSVAGVGYARDVTSRVMARRRLQAILQEL
ncbi:glycosyltransferase [Cognatiluteimonas profundi]|uniref:glycosyltransferase n=1 Tax=Cognatiluteimonas profundi TaxID=2594501 RepID=UPI00131C92E5|nr:glycosyltransferase [Lysobacter profundi]